MAEERSTTGMGAGPAAERDALLRAAVDAIVVSDKTGTIIAFNPAAERLFGYEAEEVVGRQLEMLMPEPYRSRHADYMRRYVEGGRPRIIGIGREVQARKRGGEVIPVWLSVGEAVYGDVRHFVGIIRDLSAERAAERERYALETRLAQVGRFSLLGEMAAGVAHEINQPLTAIATYSEAAQRLLAEETLDRASLERACKGMEEQARRAGQVIYNLRNLIRRQEVHREPIDLNDLIRGTMGLVEVDAAAAGLPVSVEYGEGLPPIEGNAIQLQQVLLNLTHNAVDAMQGSANEQNGIEIRTGEAGEGRVRFSVADHGPGVPENLANAIFDAFVSTKGEGLGVGLSISRTIVDAHGGELRYEPGPAGGAVFVVTLPASGSDRS